MTNLRGECERCFGLCCVAPALIASADFAIDKPAGQACPNLRADFRCAVHTHLRRRGFPGCTVFDCFGAGQKVSQMAYGGQDWRHAPAVAEQMFAVFSTMRQLHELRWYLTEALALPQAGSLHTDLRRALEETEHLADQSPGALEALDVDAHRRSVNSLLLGVSELVRAEVPGRKADLRSADLIGKGLRGADLAGANLRGAYLLGADLRRAGLRSADLIGADLRGADLRGADLRGAIFLTQPQVGAARGDLETRLPASLRCPDHWRPSAP